MKGSLEESVPVDPLIYRFHEITQVYGTTMKALIHEMFGDGITGPPIKAFGGDIPRTSLSSESIGRTFPSGERQWSACAA